jgi:hypothetical protein
MTDDNEPEDRDLLVRMDGGDEQAMTELFTRHRERLRRMIRLRLDRRLQGRIDSSDVLQDMYRGALQRRGRPRIGRTQTAASNRYIRALDRLKEMLKAMPGLLERELGRAPNGRHSRGTASRTEGPWTTTPPPRCSIRSRR